MDSRVWTALSGALYREKNRVSGVALSPAVYAHSMKPIPEAEIARRIAAIRRKSNSLCLRGFDMPTRRWLITAMCII
jgi:hypothetical protein